MTQGQMVLTTLKHVCAWRSAKSKRHEGMEAQMEVAQSRMLVCDRIASEWAENEEWTTKKKKMSIDRRDSVTFATMSVKHSVAHRPTQAGRKCQTKPREEEAVTSGAA